MKKFSMNRYKMNIPIGNKDTELSMSEIKQLKKISKRLGISIKKVVSIFIKKRLRSAVYMMIDGKKNFLGYAESMEFSEDFNPLTY